MLCCFVLCECLVTMYMSKNGRYLNKKMMTPPRKNHKSHIVSGNASCVVLTDTNYYCVVRRMRGEPFTTELLKTSCTTSDEIILT